MSNPEEKKNPGDFLKQALGKAVVVRLNSGVDYRGVLACLDGFMNIAMEQTEEYVDGQLKSRYGDCFIRGNNGMFFDAIFEFGLYLITLSNTSTFDSSPHKYDKGEKIRTQKREVTIRVKTWSSSWRHRALNLYTTEILVDFNDHCYLES